MNITIEQPRWYDGIVATTLNREEITSLILSNMYAAAMDANNTVSYEGYLYCPSGYWSQAEWLMNQFSNLKIEIPANGRYILFLDPEVLRVLLANNWGDGTGITLADISTKSLIGESMFRNNSTITLFNELGTMSNITRIGRFAFEGCTNLASINLLNITQLDLSAFARCTSLTYMNLSNIVTVGPYAFLNINNCVIDLGSSLQSLPNDLLKNEWAGTFIMRCNSAPTITGGTFTMRLYWKSNIYVPDEALNTFKQDSNWSQVLDRIHPLSEYVP